MNIYLFLIGFLLLTSKANAQEKIIYYYDENFERVSQVNAYTYKMVFNIFAKNPGGAEVVTHTKEGNVFSEYHYSDLSPITSSDTTKINYSNGTPRSYNIYNMDGHLYNRKTFYENGNLASEKQYSPNYILLDERQWYENGSLKLHITLNNDRDTIMNEHFLNPDIDSLYALGNSSIITQPEFQGGVKELLQYLYESVEYDKLALEYKVEGKVFIKFIISATGEIENAHIVNPLFPTLDFEALRAITSMPAWTPGTVNGEPVDVWYTIPVIFKFK